MIPGRYVAAGLIFLWVWAACNHSADAASAANRSNRLERLAEQEQALLEQRGILLHEASLSRYLKEVAERLWATLLTDLGAPTFQVIRDTQMDAHAYPNGHCYLTTGILNQLENEDQLAMILAHEMVHYLRQHTVELYDYLQNPLSGDGWPHAGSNHRSGDQAVQSKIDAAERQADVEGFSMILGAGYCGGEVITLLGNLITSMQELGRPEMLTMLEARRKRIEALLGQSLAGDTCRRPSAGDHERFLHAIAPALMANGQAALQRGEWKTADRSISTYLAVKPADARAYYLKGEILRRQNDDDGNIESMGYYQQALKIDPNHPLAHRVLGELHFKAGHYQMAQSYFESFLNLDTQDESREFIIGYLRQCRDREHNRP